MWYNWNKGQDDEDGGLPATWNTYQEIRFDRESLP